MSKNQEQFQMMVDEMYSAITKYIKGDKSLDQTFSGIYPLKEFLVVEDGLSSLSKNELWVLVTDSRSPNVLRIEFNPELKNILNASELACLFAYHHGHYPIRNSILDEVLQGALRKMAKRRLGNGFRMSVFDAIGFLKRGSLYSRVKDFTETVTRSVTGDKQYFADNGRTPGSLNLR